MSFGVAALINVDPATMLTVALLYPSGPRVVNANSCRYVPVTVQIQGEARRAIAIEVIQRTGPGSGLRSFERVGRVALLGEPLSGDNGCLTATMKVRRHEVVRRFAAAVNEVYAG